VRQIGGSVGVAIFATLQGRALVTARHGIVAHLNPGNPHVIDRLAAMQQTFVGRGGLDTTSARSGASAMLNFVVGRQATVLSFERMFLLAGITFLLVMPLLAFLKKGEAAPQKVDVHVEM